MTYCSRLISHYKNIYTLFIFMSLFASYFAIRECLIAHDFETQRLCTFVHYLGSNINWHRSLLYFVLCIILKSNLFLVLIYTSLLIYYVAEGSLSPYSSSSHLNLLLKNDVESNFVATFHVKRKTTVLNKL